MNIGGKLAGEFMDERRKEGRKEGERRNVLEAVGAAVQLLRRLRVPCICCGDATASLKVEAPPQPLLFRRHHRAHAKRLYLMGVYNRVCVWKWAPQRWAPERKKSPRVFVGGSDRIPPKKRGTGS